MKIISTFSGGGGSSLGYKLAGGKVLLAVEWDDNAVNTYKANNPDTPIFHGDIAKLSVEEVLKITDISIGELDIFDGSPPCQGFSDSGKRNMFDDRNQLFKEYTRLLKGLQPKTFVMENVAGMIKGNMKFIFVKILQSLKDCGYKVKAKLLNTKYYNVPQSRPRLVFIGVRNDLEIEPSFPKRCDKILTVRDAFKDCPEGERLEPKGKLVKYVSLVKQGENCKKYHPKGHYFGSSRLAWNKPSPTILKIVDTTIAMLFHPEKDLSISIEEVKRLFTFPDDYIFEGSFKDAWARMGNCVPPNFMKAIALHIKNNILENHNAETTTH